MKNQLNKMFEYFIANQEELVTKYNGSFIVIHENSVFGVYESPIQAKSEALSRFNPGEFLIQKVQAGTDTFTQTYYSRVHLPT